MSKSTRARFTSGVATSTVAMRIIGNKEPFELAPVSPCSFALSVFDTLHPFTFIGSTIRVYVNAMTVHLTAPKLSLVSFTIGPTKRAMPIETTVSMAALIAIPGEIHGGALPIWPAVFPLTFVPCPAGP